MGENEQGGMLRSVIVVGLVALIAAVVIGGVVGMKASLRTNTLMAVDAGQNLLKLKNDSIKDSATVLNDDGLMSVSVRDNGANDATLTLSPTSMPQGLYFINEGFDRQSISGEHHDRWTFSLDVKASDPANLKVYHFGVEGSTENSGNLPALTNEWQHYEVKGTRVGQFGTAVIYFKNTATKPMTVDVKNVELHRGW